MSQRLERYSQRKKELADAMARLEDALAQPYNEYLRDSVIQRFEFCYELGWKTMKLWLEGKDIDVRNAKDTLREALAQGVIEDGNGWSEMHRIRNLTSHTYDAKLAEEVYHFIKQHTARLFAALQARLCVLD